ncbi:hypothetical protein KDL45_02460 [bacterium]|nr:hypothetical protein [bacterium]
MKARLIIFVAALVVIWGCWGMSTPASAADAAAPTEGPVLMYMVDVTNSMVGCPHCIGGRRTDDVLDSVIERIVNEVNAAPRPSTVYVVPFARAVLDFDGDEGPFDPWRAFVINSDEDAKNLAVYLDPFRYGSPDGKPAPRSPEEVAVPPAQSTLLPQYTPEIGKSEPWPGFFRASLKRDLITSGVYDAGIAGLDFLRHLVPDERNERLDYVRKHLHRLNVYTDSPNGMRSTTFAHIIQGVALHRGEMDDRFWFNKVYVEGPVPDNKMNQEMRDEKRVAGTSPGVAISKFADLMAVDKMLRLSRTSFSISESLEDKSQLIEGALPLAIGDVAIGGEAESVEVQVLDTPLGRLPKGASIEVNSMLYPPFDHIDQQLNTRLKGVQALIDNETTSVTVKLVFTAKGANPMFFLSGSPEMLSYLNLTIRPPKSRVVVTMSPPGGDYTKNVGPNAWDLGPFAMRKIKAGAISDGTLTFKAEDFAASEMDVQVRFDPNLVRVVNPRGEPLSDGAKIEPGSYRVQVRHPRSPGTYTANLTLSSKKDNVVFGDGSERMYRASFAYQAKSDTPLYLGIAGGFLVFLLIVVLVAVKVLYKPPQIGEVGGKLTQLSSPTGENDGKTLDLKEIVTDVFRVGSGPACDWQIRGTGIPVIAFELVLLRGEGRLRVRKPDVEVENVKLNGVEMAETFVKDGDTMEVGGYKFTYKR